ncbi:MAG: response regulator [Deltaproteobacteria bacterium]|nr:response regulator [Deltaproteobacteria bacterium]
MNVVEGSTVPARVLVVDDSPTIRRVVETTLRRAGYEVFLAGDGQDGLDQAQRVNPDLILLDFVMPKLNGFQVCRALRQIDNLRHVPVVLMSVKSERIGDQFIGQTGAFDAITKPFAPDALLAVIGHALSRARAAATPPPPPPAVTPPPFRAVINPLRVEIGADTPTNQDLPRLAPLPDPQPDSSVEPLTGDETGDSPVRGLSAKQFGAHLARILAPAIVPLAPTVRPESLATALSATLRPEQLDEIASELRKALGREVGTAALAGAIEHVALGEILQLMQAQSQTGLLTITRPGAEVVVALRTGLVDLALAKGLGPEFLIGRYLLRDDLIEREDLERVLRHRAGGAGRLLGTHLVKLGYLASEDLRHALTRQSSEVLYEVLKWSSGTFRFDKFATRAEPEAARLGLPIASILMEGFRRVDEWRLIEQQIDSFDTLVYRDDDAIAALEATGSSRLTPDERSVLDAIDGERSIREVIEASGMGPFEVCKVLFQLLTSRLLRRRP